MKYDRKQITITLDANGGTLDPAVQTTYTASYGADFQEKTIILQNPPEPPAGFEFSKWSPALPDTFPADDITCTAVYKGKICAVEYRDSGDTDFTGSKSNLPLEFEAGTKTYIPVPSTRISSADNTVSFDAWYTDDACTVPLDSDANGYFIPDTETDDISLYANWKQKYVYIDPANGDDDNSGLTPGSPMKTVTASKNRMYTSGLSGTAASPPAIVVITPISSADDVTALSGLTVPHYKNAVLKRYRNNTGTLIEMSGGNLSSIMIDGSGVSTANPVITQSGTGTFDAVVFENCAWDGIKLDGTASVTVSGDITFGDSNQSGRYAIVVPDATPTFTMSGAAKIDGTVFLGDGAKITIGANLTETNAAEIYSEKYTAKPKVLDDNSAGTIVEANYTKFTLAHKDYAINKEGYIVTSSEIDIGITDPNMKVIPLGEFTSDGNGTGVLSFAVTADAYEKLDSDAGGKYVEFAVYDLDGTEVFKSKAYVAADRTASIDAGHDGSGNDVAPGTYRVKVFGKTNAKEYWCTEDASDDIIIW